MTWQPAQVDDAQHGRYRLSRRQLLRQGAAVVAVTGLGTILSPTAFAQSATATVGPYRLPWQAGKTFRVSQTQGSSHQGAMLHAIDFALPLGEAVLAARGGTLAFREDDFSVCGGPSLATRGNYVVVDHGDGTSALYLHLQQVRVQVGQRVAQGDVLGTSGSTGWTGCTAHLHFQLQQNWGVWFARSLPVVFSDPDVLAHDASGRVRYNQAYRSGNDGGSGSPGVAAPGGTAAAPVLVAGSIQRTGDSTRLQLTAWVREQPTRQSRSLGLVPAGATVDIQDVVTGEEVEPGEARWARVRYEGRPAYLYWGVLAPDTPSPVTGTAVTRVAVSLREGPTTASARLSLLPPGSAVQVLGDVAGQALEGGGNRWAHVRTDRGTGYVYQSLLQAD